MILFAALGVSDIDAAVSWHTRFWGRPPDLVPNAVEACWQVRDGAWVYVIAGESERPGAGLAVVLVDDLDAQLAELAGRDILPARVEPVGAAGRKATFLDPDGNRVAFAKAG